MATLFFHPKRQVWYHRAVIPRNLRQYFHGRIEYWRSLFTADKDEARLKSAQWEVRVQRVLTTLKVKGDRMTSTEIATLIDRWMESSLEESEDYRAVCGPVSDEYREGVYHVLSDQFDETSEALVSCDYRTVEKDATALLQSAGIRLDRGGKDFGRFCRRLLRAKQEVLRIEADRWEGVYKEDGATLNGTRAAATPSPAPLPPSKSFAEVLAVYCKENPRPSRTEGQVQAEYKRFMAGLSQGEATPIATITKADCRLYKDSLLQARGLTLTTAIKHLSILSGVFRWAEAQGFIPDGTNPVRGLSPNKRQAKKGAAQRRPFTDAELVTVLGSPEFLTQRDQHPERYWLILLCLFHLCRREEAGQLALKDIGEEDGLPFLNITDEGADQALKNPGSRRRVPLHPSLLGLGFLDYVERMRAAGQTRLFPQLQRGANGYSDPVGKFFSRLVTKAGLTDPALVLHSLRHGGIHKLHAAGAPHSIVEVLAGHTSNTVHEQVYVHRDKLPLRLLLDGLEKLRYEDVVKRLTE